MITLPIKTFNWSTGTQTGTYSSLRGRADGTTWKPVGLCTIGNMVYITDVCDWDTLQLRLQAFDTTDAMQHSVDGWVYQWSSSVNLTGTSWPWIYGDYADSAEDWWWMGIGRQRSTPLVTDGTNIFAIARTITATTKRYQLIKFDGTDGHEMARVTLADLPTAEVSGFCYHQATNALYYSVWTTVNNNRVYRMPTTLGTPTQIILRSLPTQMVMAFCDGGAVILESLWTTDGRSSTGIYGRNPATWAYSATDRYSTAALPLAATSTELTCINAPNTILNVGDNIRRYRRGVDGALLDTYAPTHVYAGGGSGTIPGTLGWTWYAAGVLNGQPSVLDACWIEGLDTITDPKTGVTITVYTAGGPVGYAYLYVRVVNPDGTWNKLMYLGMGYAHPRIRVDTDGSLLLTVLDCDPFPGGYAMRYTPYSGTIVTFRSLNGGIGWAPE